MRMGMAAAAALAMAMPAASQEQPEVMDDFMYDATGKHAGVYLCVPEISSGIRFDEATKRWTHGHFNTDDQSLIFTVAAERTAETPSPAGGKLRRTAYAVTVSRPGEQRAESCATRGIDSGYVPIFHNGLAVCTTGFMDYKLNIGEMRFMEVYQHGYIDGRDEPGNTPWITVGRCSRI